MAYIQAGRVVYDIHKDTYQARELSRDPLDMSALRFSSPEEEEALTLLGKEAISQFRTKKKQNNQRKRSHSTCYHCWSFGWWRDPSQPACHRWKWCDQSYRVWLHMPYWSSRISKRTLPTCSCYTAWAKPSIWKRILTMSTPKDAQSILDQINSEAMSRQDIYQALNQVSKDDFLDHEMKRLGFWTQIKPPLKKQRCWFIEDKKEIEAKFAALQQNLVGKEDVEQRLKPEPKRQNNHEKIKHREERTKKIQKGTLGHEETQKKDLLSGRRRIFTFRPMNPKRYKRVIKFSHRTIEDLAQILETDVLAYESLDFWQVQILTTTIVLYSQKNRRREDYLGNGFSPKEPTKEYPRKILATFPFTMPLMALFPTVLSIPMRFLILEKNYQWIQNFFPTISFPRVRGCFTSLGYYQKSPRYSAFCTEAPTLEATLNKKKWYIAQGERFLPQGASHFPSSPISSAVISMLVFRDGQQKWSGIPMPMISPLDLIQNKPRSGSFLVVRKIIQEEFCRPSR